MAIEVVIIDRSRTHTKKKKSRHDDERSSVCVPSLPSSVFGAESDDLSLLEAAAGGELLR